MRHWQKIVLLALCIVIPSGVGAFYWYRTFRMTVDLVEAAASGNLLMVKVLYKCGADLNDFPGDGNGRGLSALMEAVDNDRETVARFLIEHKADLEASSDEVHSPLEIAIGHGNYPMVELLLENGASPNHALMQMLAPNAFVPPLDQRMCNLLKKYGAMNQVQFSTSHPVTLLYTTRTFISQAFEIDISGSWLDSAVPALRKVAVSAGFEADRPLYIISSGYWPHSFSLHAGLPVRNVGHTVPPGYGIMTLPQFKCETAETRGTLVNSDFGSGILIQHVSQMMTGLTATDEVRQFYSNWTGSRSNDNVLELQVGVRPE